MALTDIRAFVFDVFGTCVDWRASVARDVGEIWPHIDADAFADAWRGEYQPSMAPIRDGRRDYVALDVLHRENLARVMERFEVETDRVAWLVAAWERLDPWPDVPEGLQRIRQRGLVAPCSNGSVGLMVRLSRYGRLVWDCVLGAEIARAYKPRPEVYLAACAALRLEPYEVMMVAAHNDDLAAARAEGLATGFVLRPREHGSGQTTDLGPVQDWDVVADDFTSLARAVS